MRIFYQKRKTKIKEPTYLKEVFENEGLLIIKLLEDEHVEKMDKFLRSVISDFRSDDCEDGREKENPFSYEYDKQNLTYTIKPHDASIEEITGELEASNLLTPEPSNGLFHR